MEISIFEVLGPVMIGPSSSHTAGAARLTRVAAELAVKPFIRVEFGLSGSFAQTGKGHGTHMALLAGALGLAQDDERLAQAEKLAEENGLEYGFYTEELDWMHENAVHISFFHTDGTKSEIWGSSVGGGRIIINRIGDFEANVQADQPTLVVLHKDRPGVVSDVTRVLAEMGINIAVFRLARQAKGEIANATIMMDSPVPPDAVEKLKQLRNVKEVIYLGVS